MAAQIEIDAKDLFIGMSVIIDNMKKNIDAKKVTYADMEAIMTIIMPEVATMVLENEKPEDIAASSERFAGLIAQIASDYNIEIK